MQDPTKSIAKLPRQKHPPAFIAWLMIFAGVLTVYIFTLAPDIVWQDQGDYQYRVAKLDLIEEGDVVRVHPLYIITAHLVGRIGVFDFAYAANLVSAIFTAVTVANIFLIVRRLSRSNWSSFLAAGVCAFGHTTWFIGTQAQTYSMANASITAMIFIAILIANDSKGWMLYLLGLIAGLGFSVHIMSQITFAVIFVWLAVKCFKGEIKWRALVLTVVFWFLGAILVWYAVWLEYERSGEFFASLVSSVYGKWGDQVFNVGRLGHLLKNSVLFFVLNFPTPLVLLALPGIVLSFRGKVCRPVAVMLLVTLILYCVFAGRYDIPNQNHFFMPAYILISIYIGLGYWLMKFKAQTVWIVITAVLLAGMVPSYVVMANIARDKGVNLGTRRKVPYRDDYSYYLIPWQQGQLGPRKLAEQVYTKLPEGAVLAAESTVHRPLVYVHEIEGRRPDILLTMTGPMSDEVRERIASGKRVFTISKHRRYRPVWVEDDSWLVEYALSEGENIYEIKVPAEFL